MKPKTLCMLASLFLTASCRSTIDELRPSAGRSGDTVLIRGTRLTGTVPGTGPNPQTVHFSGKQAQIVKRSGNDVEVIVPSGAVTGKVTATTLSSGAYHSGGTAVSPYDFIVLGTGFMETEPNDEETLANDAGLETSIQGTLSSSDDSDVFRVTAGSVNAQKPWGYILELDYSYSAHAPGLEVRCLLETTPGSETLGPGIVRYSYTEEAWWVATSPEAEFFLTVEWTGSWPSSLQSVAYSVSIARIPIQDQYESDDDNLPSSQIHNFSGVSVRQIPMSNGTGSLSGSLLCATVRDGQETGIEDFYSVDIPPSTKTLVAIVVGAQVPGDEIEIELYDPLQQFYESSYGTESTCQLEIKASAGASLASGTWYLVVTTRYATPPTDGDGFAPPHYKQGYGILVGGY